jgi:putative SOS response-associated peptidase YedK
VVPVDGFFEWSPARQDGPKNPNGKPAKEPHYFSRRDGTTMLLAGIASHWRDPIDPSSQRSTVCLLTTVANETMEPIHHRMPVIVEEIDVDQWLTADNNDAKEELQRLFAPAGNDVIQQRVVNISVNNARNEGKHLLDQVDETPTTLF